LLVGAFVGFGDATSLTVGPCSIPKESMPRSDVVGVVAVGGYVGRGVASSVGCAAGLIVGNLVVGAIVIGFVFVGVAVILPQIACSRVTGCDIGIDVGEMVVGN
jgi:hypothetical protein